jgi:hypothetical protein
LTPWEALAKKVNDGDDVIGGDGGAMLVEAKEILRAFCKASHKIHGYTDASSWPSFCNKDMALTSRQL